jgi:RNA polymerase sigma-70 factor, ECF subfamily
LVIFWMGICLPRRLLCEDKPVTHVGGRFTMPDAERYDEFARLVRLSSSRILSYIQALLLNWNDTEDLFQETCLTLWQKFDEFRPGTNFLAWALRIAQHKVMNFQKKQARHAAFTANLRDALMAEIADRGTDTVAADLAALSGCMDKLAENDKRMLQQCYVDGVLIRQIADAMGRSPKSVQNSLHRIRTWLLECIRRELRQAEMPPRIHHTHLPEEDGP